MSENIEELREQLIEALKRHDWFFEYSDDYRDWSAGRDHRNFIRSLMTKVPDGEALYNQYRPKE